MRFLSFEPRVPNNRRQRKGLQFWLGLLALGILPDFAWAKDKGWDNRPIAKFSPFSEFSKKMSVDADDDFVLIDWKDGLIRVRVSKSYPEARAGGAIISLRNASATQPTVVKDESGRSLCTVRFKRQSIERSSFVGTGQLGTESIRVETSLFINAAPVKTGSKTEN